MYSYANILFIQLHASITFQAVTFADILVDVGKATEQELEAQYPERAMFVTCDVTKDGDVKSKLHSLNAERA